jgi:maltose alpha-D-glucosyltransferase/alpha-amylase
MERRDRRGASGLGKIEHELRYPLWQKDAVIYQLHVKSFFDADGDGFGDFAGLAQKLDYLACLGVNTASKNDFTCSW